MLGICGEISATMKIILWNELTLKLHDPTVWARKKSAPDSYHSKVFFSRLLCDIELGCFKNLRHLLTSDNLVDAKNEIFYC